MCSSSASRVVARGSEGRKNRQGSRLPHQQTAAFRSRSTQGINNNNNTKTPRRREHAPSIAGKHRCALPDCQGRRQLCRRNRATLSWVQGRAQRPLIVFACPAPSAKQRQRSLWVNPWNQPLSRRWVYNKTKLAAASQQLHARVKPIGISE